MAELKRIPGQGVMNLDITDRLLQPGQTREALNVNISESEGSNAGKVENLLGNILVGDSGIDGGACIGAYRDNGNERIYFFVTNNNSVDESNQGQHGIFEYNQTTNQTVSLIANRPGFVSRPDGAVVGGQGTKDAETTTGAITAIASQDIQTVFIDATPVGQDLFFTEASVNPVTGANLTEVNPVYYRVVGYDQPTQTITFDRPFEGPTGTDTDLDFFFGVETEDVGTWLNFHTNFTITGVNLVDGLLFWTDNRNEPRKISVDRARNNSDFYDGDDVAAVAKYAPFDAPSVTSIITVGTSNFLEDKLPRFAYRYKFNDGELSTISEFTPIVFRNDRALLIDSAAGEIPEFVNDVKQVGLSVDVPKGFGITEVEFLYKESVSQNIYILDNVVVNFGDDEQVTEVPVSYTYNSQDPFRVLPGDQLTRVYDAVPRLAKSQELVGGRLVYGNYLQNRNLPEVGFSVGIDTTEHSTFTNLSVKSRRTYQVGVVFADRYGRQSPVVLSATGNDTIFVEAKLGNLADVIQRLTITFETQLPDWAHSYRIVVKQREQEYYNWFAGTNGLTRSGDSVNKIPIDVTAVVEDTAATRPSSASVYRKLDTSGSSNVSDETLYRVRIDQNGAPQLAALAGVYETEPVESLLDIFFETSTGDLVTNVTTGIPIIIDFFNCYIVDVSSGHIELNRLRAGFNEPAFDVGVKAHIVQENFSEERRFNTLIHSSGLFNSRTGINNVNQFNEAEGGLTLSLDPSDGSIQLVYAEDTQLLIFQEDKVSRSPIDKDFIYSAEGGAVPVTSNTQFLGTVAPYAGEYGISTDPRSFAVYGTRKYFTDSNRGVVLRLSQDGLSEISLSGLKDFFRDAFRTSSDAIGSFDEYHDQYNLTIIGEGYSSNTDTNRATARDGYFTISFSESSGGWVSFKSFDQEFGITLNNTYYTANGGSLWEHNSPNVSRNNFYGRGTVESYLDVVFNDSPSIVKEFKTIGYEGSEDWICEAIVTDLNEVTTSEYDEAVAPEDTFSITLGLSSTIDNATSSGTRTFIRPALTDGDPTSLSWTLLFEPESALYEFANTDDIVVTDPNSVTGLTIGTTSIVDGRLVQPISYTISGNEEGGVLNIILNATGGAPLSPTGVLLTVDVDGSALTNSQLQSELLTFIVANFDGGTADGSIVLIPDQGYGFQDDFTGDITVASDDQDIISPTITKTADGINGVVGLTITQPTIVENIDISVSASPTLIQDISRFSLDTSGLTIGNATINPSILFVNPTESGTAIITIEGVDNISLLATIADVNGLTIGAPSIQNGNIEIEVTRTATSALEDNNFTITLVDA